MKTIRRILTKLGLPVIYREKPGVISADAVWVIVHRCWMYGPHESLAFCLWLMLTEWKHDENLVG